uniref:ENTH domain-containing protein n=1 Tax=Rhodosorus marinus TaxID=101924 RepID=A0A7S3A290_9RHOD|mmetsp:Transcript_38121/g.151246  ORF Transcript_38121/g.151246 Transcript_38121/m.151246 type:complete len:341 (+) Transcript_38121:157-1179(+)|eukprot:CAMPEP_0113964274 /NCGR_PEP_ID=MMETSP0011_2-20120614/7038_1 /TAXON_ID=101924 /ORGANISM="Rhodosorus marinus" /LENGTH=340 /DNA_ID=CAMNT_0000976537 /DNA_START=85 /DNA_END=1107 /DNA_ORIENTATION=- /assembly_acc=CAM_ASM_000156
MEDVDCDGVYGAEWRGGESYMEVGAIEDIDGHSGRGWRMKELVKKCRASVKRDVWISSVTKATSRGERPISDKVLKNLLGGIKYYGCDVISQQSAPKTIVETLKARMHEPDWIVVFKSLSVLHYLMRETVSQPFIDLVLKNKEELLFLGSAEAEASAKGLDNGALIASYAKYLLAYCRSKESVNYPPLKNNLNDPYANYEKLFYRQFESMESPELVDTIPCIMSCCSQLVSVEFTFLEDISIAPFTTHLIVRDFLHFWSSIEVAVRRVYELSNKSSGLDAAEEQILAQYDALCKEAKLACFDLRCLECSKWTMPKLHGTEALMASVDNAEAINSIGSYYY